MAGITIAVVILTLSARHTHPGLFLTGAHRGSCIISRRFGGVIALLLVSTAEYSAKSIPMPVSVLVLLPGL
jgi:hypothetical protein